MVIFVICSCLNVTGHGTTVYSVEERFSQTLQTIESIRDLKKDCKIVFCENSPIQRQHREELEKKVDKFISINEGDIYYEKLNFQGYTSGKSVAECYQMVNVIEYLEKLEYSTVIKISARYFLLDKFDINKFINDKINFRELDHGYLCCSTVLYSFPKIHSKLFQRKLIDLIPQMKITGKDIETSIHTIKKDYPDYVNFVDYIGVAGNLSPSGDYMEN